MRVIGSLTVMPDKYHKITKTLRSLINQTRKLDTIYLGVPEESVRLKTVYPPVPTEVTSLCTVVRVKDYGPITKIVPALVREHSPETVIITFDDDMIYPQDLVEKLLEKHALFPHSALGSAGMLIGFNCPLCAITPNQNSFVYRFPKFNVPPEGRKVDCLYGYPGALYLRKFFPEVHKLEEELLNFAVSDENTLMNDDVVISGYLSKVGVERRIFTDLPEVSFVLDNGKRQRNKTEISYSLDKFFQRINLAVEKAKEVGMYEKQESVSVFETVAGRVSILLSALLVLLLVIYFSFVLNPEIIGSYLSWSPSQS